MTSVFEVITLSCGYASARLALRNFITAVMQGDVPPVLLGRAAVRFGYGAEATYFDEMWTIHWSPEADDPYPQFDGVISLHREGEVAQIEVRGQYRPPFGMLGKGFDLELGQRIASNVCKQLLRNIAERIEPEFGAREVLP